MLINLQSLPSFLRLCPWSLLHLSTLWCITLRAKSFHDFNLVLLWNVVLGNRDRQCIRTNQRSSNCRLALITIEDGVCNLIPGRGQTRAQQLWTKYILKDWQITFFQVIFLPPRNYHFARVRMKSNTHFSFVEKPFNSLKNILCILTIWMFWYHLRGFFVLFSSRATKSLS